MLQRLHEEVAYLRLEMFRYVDRAHNAGPPMISSLAMAARMLEDFKASDEWQEYAAKTPFVTNDDNSDAVSRN